MPKEGPVLNGRVPRETFAGIAIRLDPRTWALGWRNAMDEDAASGKPVYVGRWLFLGPVALIFD